MARSTIQDNLKRAQVAGLSWPLPAELSDAVLEERLFARNGAVRGVRRRAESVWSKLVCELKHPGVNLMVLWEEYRAGHPEGYSYSRYVAAVVMWRTVGSSRGNWWVSRLEPQHIFLPRCGYRAFKNAIRDGSVHC